MPNTLMQCQQIKEQHRALELELGVTVMSRLEFGGDGDLPGRIRASDAAMAKLRDSDFTDRVKAFIASAAASKPLLVDVNERERVDVIYRAWVRAIRTGGASGYDAPRYEVLDEEDMTSEQLAFRQAAKSRKME